MILPKKPLWRHSGFNGMQAAAPVAKGAFMYNAGSFNTGTHAAVGTAGYASAGDSPRMLLAGTTSSGVGVFPVNKHILKLEGADQDNDTIASGRSLIFYEGGEFETDAYNITASGTGNTPGTALHLDSTGLLTTTATAGNLPIAETVKVSSAPSTSTWWTGGTAGAQRATLWYRLYPHHSGPHQEAAN
jgi:hypothetical protein